MYEPLTIDRRTFLAASVGLVFQPQPPRQGLQTLSEWLTATPEARAAGLKDCLERIRTLDPSIRAWVKVDPQKPTGTGPLSDIPFAAKDIIETRGLPTEYGSPVYKGRIGTEDAAIVREMRRRGGILMGKTHTTAFAYRTPGPTRNPRNPEHTPGGSSSGSAAAIAAGMVPVALGTQTGGSVLRPASFCGVTGFKPTYGVLPMEGVLPLAPSLDTLGFFTHTPADMVALWGAMGYATGRSEEVTFGVPDPLPPVDAPMAAAIARAVDTIGRAGASVRKIDIAGLLARLTEANATIMLYEGARVHEQRFAQYGDRLDAIAEMVREGLEIPAARYDDAKQYVADSRIRFAELYNATPIILVPAAPGPAPRGLASTGDARMNRPWTALGTPAISIPMPVGGALPLGLQLTADRGQDARVLNAAIRVAAMLRS